MTVADDVQALYPRLIAGDPGVLAGFAAKATIDSPLGGKQEPAEFVAETRAWLHTHQAIAQDVHTTIAPQRVVHELTLTLMLDGKPCELPVMLVADAEEDSIRDLRVYHSTWPLTGSHLMRHPLMQYALTERPAEPVRSYHEALAEADPDKADAAFEPDGSVREPAGGKWVYSGAERTEWYRNVLAEGPIVLHLGTITDDGETVVYEYMVDRWGHAPIPQQAGAAAYQRGASGKLCSARIYDDVTPPPEIVGE